MLQSQDTKSLIELSPSELSDGIALEWKELIEQAFMGKKVFILDTETTGMTKRDAIIELCVINAGNAMKAYHEYFMPLSPIHPEAYKVHTLNARVLEAKGAKNWSTNDLDLIEDLLSNSIVLEWGKGFDKRLLTQTAEKLGRVDYGSSISWRNVMRDFGLYWGEKTAAGKGFKDKKLLEAVKLIGMEASIQEVHTAHYDCIMVKALMRKVVEKYNAQQVV